MLLHYKKQKTISLYNCYDRFYLPYAQRIQKRLDFEMCRSCVAFHYQYGAIHPVQQPTVEQLEMMASGSYKNSSFEMFFDF